MPMDRSGNISDLNTWLSNREVSEIKVISPHLDDAAFSLATFLTEPDLPARCVLTVFTRAGPRTPISHAIASGFATPEEEYSHRRQEDVTAMERLGVVFGHLGLESGDRGEDKIDQIVDHLNAGAPLDGTLVLLPLGAGGTLSSLTRLLRRGLRKPMGCPPHGEHLWIRDTLRSKLALSPAGIGYYAEIPYQWANSAKDLSARAKALNEGRMACFTWPANAKAKLMAAANYKSQFEGEFGTTPTYQMRTAECPEKIFVPAGA